MNELIAFYIVRFIEIFNVKILIAINPTINTSRFEKIKKPLSFLCVQYFFLPKTLIKNENFDLFLSIFSLFIYLNCIFINLRFFI